jgi:hypothetical protein
MNAAQRAAMAVAAVVLVAAVAQAEDAIRKQPVRFKPGTSAETIRNTLKGDETIDYVLAASAGQRMTVTLKSSNSSLYFNVLPPGSEEAIFIGSTSGNTWSGDLLKDGDYSVRVYLMRNAARRDEKATYALTIGVSGSKAEK